MDNPVSIKHQELGFIKPQNVHCVCRNFAKHAAELGNKVTDSPVFFEKSNASIVTGETIILPDSGNIHHELEIVVLFGQGGEGIKSENVKQSISGITLGIDFTDRKFQSELKEKRLPWFLSKSFKNSAWVGTFETPDWNKWSREFWLTVNGKERQRGQIRDMIYSIETQVSYFSNLLPILPGDIMYTGTPEGVDAVNKGDILRLGLGQDELFKVIIK